jgi:hypothetical protein
MKNKLCVLIVAGVSCLPAVAENRFDASLSGAQEVVIEGGVFVPGGTDTDASGKIVASFDREYTRVWVNLKIDDLTGNFAAAHFHCGRPGVNGPVAFGLVAPGPLQFDGKGIRGMLTNIDFTGADCTTVVGRPVNNIAALAFAMRNGLIYVNVHTDVFPAGEQRGQMSKGKGQHKGHDSDDDDD